MSDARQYAVWPNPRSRSRLRALESCKSFHFQKLSPLPFKWDLATDHWFVNYSTTSKFYSSFCHVTLNLAETTVVIKKSRPSVLHGANLLKLKFQLSHFINANFQNIYILLQFENILQDLSATLMCHQQQPNIADYIVFVHSANGQNAPHVTYHGSHITGAWHFIACINNHIILHRN